MDASYDGSFDSLSAGGKDPGGEVFDGGKNDAKNASNEVKLEQSAGDVDNTDFAVDHSAADNTDLAINHSAESNSAEPKLDPSIEANGAEPKLNPSITEGNTDLAVDHSKAADKAIDVGVANVGTDAAAIATAATPTVTEAPTAVMASGDAPNSNVAMGNTINSGMVGSTGAAINSGMVNGGAINGGIGVNSGAMNSNVMNNNMMSGGMMNGNMMGGGMTGGMNGNAPITSTSASGISLSNGAGAKKPKKSLVIGGIIAVALVFVGALVGLSFMKKGGGSQVENAEPLREAFNSYINYVWYGEDSTEDFDISEINKTQSYFLQVKESGEGKEEYLEIAAEKYAALEESYFNDDYEGEELSDLSSYYQDYVALPNVSYERVLEEYANNGYESATKYIDETYPMEGDGQEITNYTQAVNKELKIILEMGVEANTGGCFVNSQINYDCFVIPDEIQNDFNVASMETIDALEMFGSVARLAVSNMYIEIYGEDYGNVIDENGEEYEDEENEVNEEYGDDSDV